MNKKIRAAILSILVVSSVSHRSIEAKLNNNGFAEGLFIAGATAIGLGCVATAINYCFSESNDQLIARVESEFSNASNAYKCIFYDFYCDPSHTGLETQLYEIASVIWNKGQSQSGYRSGMKSARDTLSSSLEKLRKRYSSLVNKRNYEDQILASKIKALINKVEDFLPELTALYNFMEKHRYYFDLYESEGKIRNCYSNLIAIVQSGSFQAAYDIKQAVLYADSGRYPYINFVRTIKANISTLKTDVRYLSYNYQNRVVLAQQLIDTLSWISGIVVADPRYASEQYQLEQERLEQERQRLAREQLEIFRNQVRIQEAQVRAQQEQARASRELANAVRLNKKACGANTTADFQINFQVDL